MGGASERGRAAVIAAMVPLAVLLAAFVVLPTATVVVRAWELDHDLGLGLLHVEPATDPWLAEAIQLAAASTIAAIGLGTVLAVALGTRRRPRWLAAGLHAWARARIGVGPIPLTFAFVVAVGAHGALARLATTTAVGLPSTRLVAPLEGFGGRVIVDLYLLVPLTMLVLVPAVVAIPREWAQHAAVLGCSPARFLRRVAGPVLLPAVVGASGLVFVTSIVAAATTRALGSIERLGGGGLGPDLPAAVVGRELRLTTVSWVIALLVCTLLLAGALQRRSMNMVR